MKELIEANKLENPDKLRIGQKLMIPRPGAPVAYKIQSGDTLGGIAKKHNVALSTLVAYNKISRPDRIRPGQVIYIPTDPGFIARKKPQLPASLKQQLDKIPIRSGRWKYIVIHHSATQSGSPKGMDEYHRRKRGMKNGLAYHFVIGNGRGMRDGEIAVGNRWKGQLNGGHLRSSTQNTYSIGICLVGNFDLRRPTANEMASLEALVGYLMNRCNIPASKVKTHREINTKPTRCPGRNFRTWARWPASSSKACRPVSNNCSARLISRIIFHRN